MKKNPAALCEPPNLGEGGKPSGSMEREKFYLVLINL